jgi:hypothetical protein
MVDRDAERIHKKSIIVEGHRDLFEMVRLSDQGQKYPLLNVTYPRLKRANITTTFYSIAGDSVTHSRGTRQFLKSALENIDMLREEIEASRGKMRLILHTEDLVLRIKWAIVFNEVEPQPDVIDAYEFSDMADMVDQTVKRGLLVYHRGDSVDAEHAAGLRQRPDLVVVDSAKVMKDLAAVGVSAAHWTGGDFENIEPARAGNVRQVNDHAEPIHLPHHVLTEIRESAARAFLLHAVSQFVTQIPGDLHGAQAEAIERA